VVKKEKAQQRRGGGVQPRERGKGEVASFVTVGLRELSLSNLMHDLFVSLLRGFSGPPSKRAPPHNAPAYPWHCVYRVSPLLSLEEVGGLKRGFGLTLLGAVFHI